MTKDHAKNTLERLLGHIAPHHCPLCEARSETYLCKACIAQLCANDSACQTCALPLPRSSALARCGECLAKQPAFDTVIAPFIYEPNFADALGEFKRNGKLRCGRQLSNHLVEAIEDEGAQKRIDLIVPVPSHAHTEIFRGFNPAAVIATHLSRKLHKPLAKVLQKKEKTPKQKTMRKHERHQNLKNAFTVRSNRRLPKPRVALIDDVITTGTTASICSEQLRSAGASYIEVWALARTPKH